MADLIITERSNIVAIADAVRNRTGETGEITIGQIVNDINYVVGGIDTSDATASADEIMSGETAYVNGKKVTGTFSIDNELDAQSTLLSEQDAKIAELAEILSGKAGGGSGNSSYDTCTISIEEASGLLYGYCATCFDGKDITYKYNFLSSSLGNITITDVICGSPLSIICRVYRGSILYQNLTLVNNIYNCAILIAPNQAETIATIQIGAANDGGSA